MKTSGEQFNVEIIQGGPNSCRQFQFEDQACVLLNDGPFVIRVTNRSPGRVEALVSVDGLSVMDGKPAPGNAGAGFPSRPSTPLTSEATASTTRG